MKIDTQSYPLIDNHLHPFPMGREKEDLEQYWCISLLPQDPYHIRRSLPYQMSFTALGQYLGLEADAPPEEIIERRNSLYRADPAAYVTGLYRAANLQGLLVDFGYPIAGPRLTAGEVEEFNHTVDGIPVGGIARIEHVCDDLLREELPFDDFAARFKEGLRTKVRTESLVALKSVIAYHTGLGIELADLDSTQKGYDALLKNRQNRAAEKLVRDFCFFAAVDVCLEIDIPMQIHTGMGDSPMCDLMKTNPLLLHEALGQKACQDATLVLIHAGYPFVCEMGFLVSHYPNLYVDVSSMVPFAGVAAESKLMELMEMAPFSKILYGSDGGGVPEHTWAAAMQFRGILERTLNYLIDGGFLRVSIAEEAAELICFGNVLRVYGKRLPDAFIVNR